MDAITKAVLLTDGTERKASFTLYAESEAAAGILASDLASNFEGFEVTRHVGPDYGIVMYNAEDKSATGPVRFTVVVRS